VDHVISEVSRVRHGSSRSRPTDCTQSRRQLSLTQGGGKERKCIGHDRTEVIELIPAEVIVRLDQRELLVCEACEGELERAPLGDKVISGGIYGSTLVSTMFVRKYDHGMTLHRQRPQCSPRMTRLCSRELTHLVIVFVARQRRSSSVCLNHRNVRSSIPLPPIVAPGWSAQDGSRAAQPARLRANP
jgi:hypothetical protein